MYHIFALFFYFYKYIYIHNIHTYLHMQELYFPELFGHELYLWWPVTPNSLMCPIDRTLQF